MWERPLRRADLEALGENAPAGEILGARVADLGVKYALITGYPGVYFTIPHFDGYTANQVRLERIEVPELEERRPAPRAGSPAHAPRGQVSSA